MKNAGKVRAVITSNNAKQLIDQLGQAGLINPEIYQYKCRKCGLEIITNDINRCPEPECLALLSHPSSLRIITFEEWNRKQMLAHSLPYLAGQIPSL